MRLELEELAAAAGCTLPEAAGNVTVTAVVTDSRAVRPGTLFVCLAGENVDGHDFALTAQESGAAAVLGTRAAEDMPAGLRIPYLRADDAVTALGRMAACWRSRCTGVKVVGITGTAGKTTVKELLAQTLALQGKTARNPVNLNNQIGLPLSLLATDGDEAFWVMEVGISHEGDMDELGEILRPDAALILNVGAGHTEGLGARGVAWHKARLLRHVPREGICLISADYPDLVREARAVRGDLHYFTAEGRPLQFRGAAAGRDGERGRYRLSLDGKSCDVSAPFRGGYGTENCIAVAAMASLLGLAPETIARGIAGAELPAQRFVRQSIGPWSVIDDTYNANPLSMLRMLDAAAELAQSDERDCLVAVLGEMRELGELAEAEHERLGRHLAELRPCAVIWKGGQGEAVRAGLERGGYAGLFRQPQDAAEFVDCMAALGREHPQGGLALFKGSRGNALEVWLTALRDGAGERRER
ncbi:UDP-N-acetylmuramoyl-tripeptide--D-alanyl-D-alanine ligase [uncultured Desulfovibrio sp.]|uniref:UDP-N-acetylmuramoyl-tripeptide--D-alanyl-D- alanine ligase n=1 Tax=uncultured Desulfovibrio sp. TaxID=167968 RepID=UPI002610F008|nr:UDP-N-acetylmuramoyl-tripeptide--D-alanyl-D-alanine ligase [uncultured Desulfovibrio sp.]